MVRSQISAYRNVNSYSGVTDANPHQLVKMLIDGAIGKLSTAKGMMSRGEMSTKGEVISQAVSIITGLQSSLDFDQGGDIAINLDSLYDYMVRRLTKANIDNDIEIVDEVLDLLKQISAAWEGIPQDLRATAKSPVAAVEQG